MKPKPARDDLAPVDDVFDRCWEIVWPTVYSVVGNKHTAEDAAQEAMSRIFKGLHRFDDQRPLEPWVRRIAVNTALNELRKERRAPVPVEWAPQLENAESRDAYGGATSSKVLEAVAELKPVERAAIALHYWFDLPLREVATILEVPQGTAASLLSRAREKLRTRLEAEHV